MEYGIKRWSTNYDSYEQVINLYKKSKIDYLELLYIPGEEKKLELLKNSKIPIIIHAPTSHQNISFSDSNFERNNKIFNDLLRITNHLNS
ncbi:hypothetical protein ACFLZB_04700, partial [Nanoarchaeota archaeon]